MDATSGKFTFKKANGLKNRFLDRELRYTAQMNPEQLFDCVSEVFRKRAFHTYDWRYANCEAFARAVERELDTHPGIKLVPNGLQQDPYRLKWPERIRSLSLKDVTKFSQKVFYKALDDFRGINVSFLLSLWLACPRLSLIIALVLVAPWVGWVVALVYMGNGCCSHWAVFKNVMHENRVQADARYRNKPLLYLGCRYHFCLGLGSITLASVQCFWLFPEFSLTGDSAYHVGLVQILLVTWESFFKWHELFGVAFADWNTLAWKIKIWGFFDSFPMGGTMAQRFLALLRLCSLLDMFLRLVFLSGSFCLHSSLLVSMGLSLLLWKDYLDNKSPHDQQTQQKSFLKFLQMEIPKFLALVIMSVMVVYQSDSWFQIQSGIELGCLYFHMSCMLLYCVIGWTLKTLDTEIAVNKAISDSSDLMERMEQWHLLDSNSTIGLFKHPETQDVLKSATHLRTTTLPRLKSGMTFTKLLSKVFPVIIVPFVLACLVSNSFSLMLVFFTLSTWVLATLNYILLNISSRVTMFCKLTTNNREGLKTDHCALWQLCPDPSFKRDQDIHVCTLCGYTFCGVCHLRLCSREHPFYVVQVKANWSPLDDLILIRKGAMEPPE